MSSPSILSPPEIARCEASHGCIWSCAAAGGTPQLALHAPPILDYSLVNILVNARTEEKGSKTGSARDR